MDLSSLGSLLDPGALAHKLVDAVLPKDMQWVGGIVGAAVDYECGNEVGAVAQGVSALSDLKDVAQSATASKTPAASTATTANKTPAARAGTGAATSATTGTTTTANASALTSATTLSAPKQPWAYEPPPPQPRAATTTTTVTTRTSTSDAPGDAVANKPTPSRPASLPAAPAATAKAQLATTGSWRGNAMGGSPRGAATTGAWRGNLTASSPRSTTPTGSWRGTPPSPGAVTTTTTTSVTSTSTAQPAANAASSAGTTVVATSRPAPAANAPAGSDDSGAVAESQTTTKAAGASASGAAKPASSPADPSTLSKDNFLKLSDDDFMNAVRDGKIPKEVSDSQDGMLALQARVNHVSEMNQMMTSMMQAMHQMEMGVIENLRV